jgi:ABC-type branched-subunit amino acid transport system substrate-binding protein
VSAAGPAGLTSSTITLGQLADVSGPVPGLFSGSVDGTDAWAAYVNSTGGIGGRRIVIDHKDSALSCPAFTNGIQSLVRSTFAIVGSASVVDSCGTATLKAHPDFPDIPAFLVSTSVALYPNVFLATPEPPGWPTSGYQWVKDKYGAAAVQKTAFLWGTTEQSTFEAQSAAAASIGYKVIYNRGTSPFETNFTSDILRMKADGVEVVDVTDQQVGNIADFLEQAAQQGFHPDAVITLSSYDASFFKLLGDPADASNLVMPLTFALYLGQDASAVPEITTMTDWFHKTHPGDQINLYVLEAWSAGLLFQRAMAKVGPDPSQSKLLDALRGVTSFDANGLLPEHNPGQKVPSPCVVITQAVAGKFVRVDPPTSGFDCTGTYALYHSSSS